jgi:5-methylcytosine-specific restriction endonuclease McrA
MEQKTLNQCKFCGKPTETKFCSLSCSGKQQGIEHKIRYEANPKKCKHCSGPISYEGRNENVYCSRSCSITVNNKVPKRKKKFAPKTHWKILQLQDFERGEIATRLTIRKLLIKTKGNQCAVCSLPGIWHGKPITMIVDHEDGNASNNLPSNLRLLCPNCNSQTPTFCGRNKGNGRGSRGLSRKS